jgi:uncharacterized protein (DUF1810 family)
MTGLTADDADPFDLNRFVQAQAPIYADALAELVAGCKRSHWMWFVLPQIDGLGFSATTKLYSIKSLAEARAYLAHPILGARLVECTRTVLAINGKTALDIFGKPDDMKLRSSMTLFAAISPAASVFSDVLDKYYNGKRDPRTVELIKASDSTTTNLPP